MTSPEFQEYQPVEPANVAAEVAALLDTPDDPDRRPARPHEANPEATSYLNGVEDIAMGDAIRQQFVSDERAEVLDRLRAEIAAVHAETEELDPEEASRLRQLEVRVHAAQRRKANGIVESTDRMDKKYATIPSVEPNEQYL